MRLPEASMIVICTLSVGILRNRDFVVVRDVFVCGQKMSSMIYFVLLNLFCQFLSHLDHISF